jgi:hypothetical protein
VINIALAAVCLGQLIQESEPSGEIVSNLTNIY